MLSRLLGLNKLGNVLIEKLTNELRTTSIDIVIHQHFSCKSERLDLLLNSKRIFLPLFLCLMTPPAYLVKNISNSTFFTFAGKLIIPVEFSK